LTSVFFEKEVLDRYYSDTEKYSISSGHVSRGSIWNIGIDNNLQENVCVFLGDLGRLPTKEQKHWKLYNIPKGKFSESFYRRNIMAEFCSPDCPVGYFKEKMQEFNSNWKEKFGWYLFKPLNEGDEHHWKALRIPRKENQKEFDDNVLSLTKILIYSLNQVEMKAEVGHIDKEREILLLERYLREKHNIASSQMITYLKDLHNLRSIGSAHRKGSDFKKTFKKYDKGDFSKTFEEIIIGAVWTLRTIGIRIFLKKDYLKGNN